jgi:uncharacterized membrane protein YeiH
MNWLTKASHHYTELVPSIPFMSLHALSISYYVTKLNPNQNLFSLLVATFVLGFGGGILTSLILGRPMLFVFDQLALSLYGLMTVFVARTGVFVFVDINFEQIQPLFILVDALARAYVMPGFLVDFRMQQPGNYSGRESFLGQLIMTVLYVTGGGFLFAWIFKKEDFNIKGWFVQVITVTTVLLIGLFDILESNNGSTLYTIRNLLLKNRIEIDTIGIEQIQFFTACIITIGFFIRPDVDDEQDCIEKEYVFVSKPDHQDDFEFPTWEPKNEETNELDRDASVEMSNIHKRKFKKLPETSSDPTSDSPRRSSRFSSRK